MADNTTLDAGTGGDSIATDDIGGVKHQRVKVQYGEDGSATDVSDTNPLPVDDAGGSLSVDDGGGSLTVDVGTALPAGTNNIGDVDVLSSALPTGAATSAKQDTVIGHLDGVEGLLTTIDADTGTVAGAVSGSEMQVDVVTLPATPAGTNLIGAVNLRPTTANGLTIFRSIDLDETEEEIKATAGQLYGWYIGNLASSVRHVKFYNATAANVTVGTTTPVLTVSVPAASAANVEFTNGIAFSTAITAAATTGVADSDTGAPGANEVVLNAFYA